ncbi:hypothetical protein GUITHDRAFT_109528 [Guillardia theta CCMP2712]|uniref:Uncharacterized protein n=1 Tax=Guillardia theta (strain CCMP2712) TaxID=905079 RepID=L1J7V9_GUITC|nr:hypothetical protein GUITHDRAFT_109528 [Guillardia theta CCMP2712]EKX44407.1 hypothetical protein GUITHDRAFT_109528 [Guillardia theta CCMP2712]|eukprot:XP_005831387.1 hypothetical protein GUITHDRAFT_109528 [Guillardia theta CCMP2712]
MDVCVKLHVDQLESTHRRSLDLGRDGDVVDLRQTETQTTAMVDDGSGVVSIDCTELYKVYDKYKDTWRLAKGMYVMAQGILSKDADQRLHVICTKIADLSANPDRFAMWMCEVVDADRFKDQLLA